MNLYDYAVSPGDCIVVWFSCGAASAVAALETVRLYGGICSVRVVNNPVKEEHEDNLRFLSDVQSLLGQRIEIATNPDFPTCSAEEVWDKRRYMSGVSGAPCTMLLKKRARQLFESANRVDWNVLGFTAEEVTRHANFVLSERSNVLPVLISGGYTKQDCVNYLGKLGVRLPEIYALGFPNANCIGCVKATSPSYWNHVRKVFPEVFEKRAIQSKELGARLVRVKNKRIFLSELPPDAKGRSMKSMKIECGIFCEEKQEF